MKTWPSYILINLGLLLGAFLIFLYTYFIASLSLPCMVRELSGAPCASCGFTRAFASFLQFNFELGKSFNELAMPVFLFFAGQVSLRILMVFVYFVLRPQLKPQLVKIDILASISVFLLAFLPLVNFI
jgi:hypothetical protein